MAGDTAPFPSTIVMRSKSSVLAAAFLVNRLSRSRVSADV